jgi:hypothetical protein
MERSNSDILKSIYRKFDILARRGSNNLSLKQIYTFMKEFNKLADVLEQSDEMKEPDFLVRVDGKIMKSNKIREW